MSLIHTMHNYLKGGTAKQIYSLDEVSPGDYILQYNGTNSVYHEGDERSRTSPGHGYPEYTETFDTCAQYLIKDKTVLASIVESHLKTYGNLKGISATQVGSPIKLEIKTSVSVGG